MCTCTFIPTQNGFLFAANRDEIPSRSGIETVKHEKGRILWYIQEPYAGGTNLCMSNENRLVCLLNGAGNKRPPEEPFRKSRGLVVLDTFQYDSFEHFYNDYSFEGINEFTLISVENNCIFLLKWDDETKIKEELSFNEPHIWASPKLYDSYWQQRRKLWFEDFLNKNPNPTLENLLMFQEKAGDGSVENDMVMNRGELVRTVSVSAFAFQSQHYRLKHMNLITEQLIERSGNFITLH